MELTLLSREMNNVGRLYTSHRLYVYQSCINIFHRLFVEKEEELVGDDVEPIEDIIQNVQRIFEEYHLDSIYYHLRIVFEYLKLEYYDHYKVYRKAENYFEEVNDSCADLLSNYTLYTYPAQFLITKIKRHMRMGTVDGIYEENEGLFHEYEPDKNDLPNYITYVTYRSLACYYSKKYDEAARWINNLLNEISLKRYPAAQLEVKSILALQYCMVRDYDLFNQLINSIQRQIRLLGKDTCEHVIDFTKMLKISISDSKRNKKAKIQALADRMKIYQLNYFTPTLLVKVDEEFVDALSRE